MNENHKKILLAEDEPDLREALVTALSSEGYEVHAAKDGDEALTLALAEHPDLVLLDLIMPGRGGQEVLQELRKDEWGKDVRVIILTALDDMETLSKMLEEGSFDYLVKSDWKLEDIVKKVREIIG